ncbi:MAG: N-acetylmuramoyl-L-alanine amidase [uncultured Chthoniobacterales bacterium]|uniref:N-acetylmuramoyl-L-alanine amidase n=1 Tax=uncultured Chthoniobacterales bacterium TaxID=1836801 RepID=A0A6J4HDV5_9BACT|nr:MAG: N-acetylmuramoyl-L-alanine amidase [uncultured Chthoniobacterales bacterium]
MLLRLTFALLVAQLGVSAAIAQGTDRAAGPLRIAIDIGHTPGTPGAMSAAGEMEYTFNRRVARLIADDLRQQPGVSVTLINEPGREISLLGRGDVANTAKADLFLSVHHDSVNERYKSTRRTADGRVARYSDRFRGYSVFFSEKNAEPAASLEFAKQLGRAMREQGMTPTAHHAEKIPGEGRDFVVPETGVYRFNDLLVLKRARMPAALLECGVIVHPEEEQELNTPERQRQIVAAVRSAVVNMSTWFAARRQ